VEPEHPAISARNISAPAAIKSAFTAPPPAT
jgi:hypothetical protein